MFVRKFDINTSGRDFAVGDIHGQFTALEQDLAAVGFDPRRDRLFSVGDLVDRGPESERALEWLDYPWFHAVMGNHEDFVCRHEAIGRVLHVLNGGEWFWRLEEADRQRYVQRFRKLPLALEVAAGNGRVGIVHAECPVSHWDDLPAVMEDEGAREYLLSSRRRVELADSSWVNGITAVVVGHNVVGRQPLQLGNVVHIDTGGWTRGGGFTLLDLDSLVKQFDKR